MPALYTEFCDRVGFQLTEGQRIFARVAFDGEEPEDVHGSELFFGPIKRIPPLCRKLLIAVCGGRAGKTLLCAYRLLHLGLTVPLHLRPGEQAAGLFMAPDLERARQGLRYASGIANASPAIKKLIVRDTVDTLAIRRPDGHVVTLEAAAASRGGLTGRGKVLVGVVMDEAAFFRDKDSGVVNDAEIFKAVRPRIAPDGQLLVPSTPFLPSGVLYEFFESDYGKPKNALVAHAPTHLLNPSPHILEQIASERERDPENAKREFDAEFVSGGLSNYFDPEVIKSSAKLLGLGREATPGAELAACLDAGFRSDSSALAIVQRVGDVVSVLDLLELRPEPGKPLKPSAVCAAFAERLQRYAIERVAADAFYVEAIREYLASADIAVDELPAGNTGKAEQFSGTRTYLHERRLELPQHPGLLRDLRGIVSRPAPGGGLTITSPRRATGGHGDIASALVGAIWQLGPDTVEVAEEPTPVRGSREWADQWVREQREKMRLEAMDDGF